MNTAPDANQPRPESSIPPTEPIVIPVIEEQLRVEQGVIEAGKVRVSKHVHEEHQIVSGPAVREEVHVERVPINQYVDVAPPAVRHEGDTMIMPVLREVLVVEKRILFVEEVHITKRQVPAESHEHVTLRREEIVVERVPTDPNQPVG
jgi:uncharacterized protein (TIGR02271 family)